MAATHKNMRQENRPLFVFNQKLINGSYGRSRFIQVYNYNSLMTEVLSKSGYVGLLPIRVCHLLDFKNSNSHANLSNILNSLRWFTTASLKTFFQPANIQKAI